MNTSKWQLLFFLTFACKSVEIRHAQQPVKFPAEEIPRIAAVSFDNGLVVHWDNVRHNFAEDSMYRYAVVHFKESRDYLVDHISDTTATWAVDCRNANRLMKGDIAFALISSIEPLPYFEVLQTQLDVYDKDCPYPVSLFDIINKKREVSEERVRRYLRAKISNEQKQ